MRNVRVGRGSKVTFMSRVNDREYPYKPGAFLASAALFGEVDMLWEGFAMALSLRSRDDASAIRSEVNNFE